MDREEFDKTYHFSESKCCLTCWWVTWDRSNQAGSFKPATWRCSLMQELGVSEAGSVIVKPEDFSCGRYEV